MVLLLEEDEDTKPEQPHRTYVYSIVTSFPFSKPDGKFSTEESRLAYAKLEKEWSQHMKSLPDAKDNDDEDEDEESEAEESEVEESEAEEFEAEEEYETEESEADESEVDESEVEESEVEESEAEESEAEYINSESDAEYSDEEPPRNLTAINQNMRNLSIARQDKANYV
ncbi:hypothetical protein V8G54_034249 [Vigna mungo]|uniref:Uncharacterized protein n=1 Tax=Vigna mungo TaxID=3915 RepID=A0AAQ3MPV7_VIGMU